MLKKTTIPVLLAAALLLTGCSAPSDTAGDSVLPESKEVLDLEAGGEGGFIDLQADDATESELRLMALVWAGMARTEWESVETVHSDYFIDFYRILASDQFGEVKIPKDWDTDEDDSLLMPADEVEQVVQRHFDVSAEQLRTSSYYNSDIHCYRHNRLGLLADARITGFSADNGDGLSTIAYDLFQDEEYLGSGLLTLKMNGEDYRYVSNGFVTKRQAAIARGDLITYTEEELPVNTPEHQDYLDRYVIPVAGSGIFNVSFDSEDLSPLLERGLESIFLYFLHADPGNTVSVTDEGAVLEQDFVEGVLRSHLNLATEEIRKNLADCYDAAAGTYTIYGGIGGGEAIYVITESKREDGVLDFSYDCFYRDYENNDEISYIIARQGRLQIAVEGEDFRYLSHSVWDGPGIE